MPKFPSRFRGRGILKVFITFNEPNGNLKSFYISNGGNLNLGAALRHHPLNLIHGNEGVPAELRADPVGELRGHYSAPDDGHRLYAALLQELYDLVHLKDRCSHKGGEPDD